METKRVGATDIQKEVTVRRAQPKDMTVFRDFIQEMADADGHADGPRLTVEQLVEDGFKCSSPWFFVLLAEMQGEVVGTALCSRTYWSWSGRTIYLQSLYVRPHARRLGVGDLLFREICKLAIEEGVQQIDWHVPETNRQALLFYARFRARDMHTFDDHAMMRLDRHRIADIAKIP